MSCVQGMLRKPLLVSESIRMRLPNKGCITKGSYHHGHLGLSPTGEHWEILQNTLLIAIPPEKGGNWDIDTPAPVC